MALQYYDHAATVRRHNSQKTQHRNKKNEINGKKIPEISKIFSKIKTHKASAKLTMDNCNHSKLLKEISPGEVQNEHAQINYTSTGDNKCERTRAKNTIK